MKELDGNEAEHGDKAPTRALLERYRAGEDGAERRLFAAAHAVLAREVRRHRYMAALRFATSDEDIVNETLVRVISAGSLLSFRAEQRGALRNWLRRVLEHVLIGELRRHGAIKRSRPLAHEPSHAATWIDVDGLAARDTTPTERAAANDLRRRIRAVLAPREWEAWSLVCDRGLDSNEIARRLGATPGAVRALLQRIRSKLLREPELRRRAQSSSVR